MPIQSLYEGAQINPRNENFSALIAECLHTKGVVDESFTKDDWDRFVAAFGAAFSVDEEGYQHSTGVDPPTLPGGVAMDDPRVSACTLNPLGLDNPMGW